MHSVISVIRGSNGSFGGRSGVVRGSFGRADGRSGPTAAPFFSRRGGLGGSIWVQFGFDLGLIQVRLSSIRDGFGVHSGSIWVNLVNLGSLLGRHGIKTGSI